MEDIRAFLLSNSFRAAGTTGARASDLRSAFGSGFTNTGTTLGTLPVFSASSADYDADGKLDILIDGCTDALCDSLTLRLYRNNGDGTFSENTASGLPGEWIGSTVWGDYDSDGFADVLISGRQSFMCQVPESRLYHNDGNGTFSVDASAGLLDDYGWFIPSDYNADGVLDFVMYDAAPTRNAVIYRNTNTPSGDVFYPPDGLKVRLTGARQATFSWETNLSKGLDNDITYNLRVGTTPGASDVVSALSASPGRSPLPARGR